MISREEALNKILECDVKSYGVWTPPVKDMIMEKGLQNELDLIKQALRYPTEEEVCKAILDSRSDISKVEHRFNKITGEMDFLIYEGSWKSWLSDWGMLDLPPRIITMIGKFYEGSESE